MSKLERDGAIAVIYSPGFGAGWSTWGGGEHGEALCTDSVIAEAVLAGDTAAAFARAAEIDPNAYRGSQTLCIEWVPKGSRFEITEYDGSEAVRVIGPDSYYTA